MENVAEDVALLKTTVDDVSSTQVRRTLANLSQEIAKLNANMKELAEARFEGKKKFCDYYSCSQYICDYSQTKQQC